MRQWYRTGYPRDRAERHNALYYTAYGTRIATHVNVRYNLRMDVLGWVQWGAVEMSGIEHDGKTSAQPLDKRRRAGVKPTLHKSQAAILAAVSRYYRAHRGWPSRREIAAESGVTLGGPLDYHVRRLSDAGLLVIVPRMHRGIQLTTAGEAWVRSEARKSA